MVRCRERSILNGYLVKDGKTNKVTVSKLPLCKEDKRIETQYRTLASSGGLSLLEVHLITGRSHQIRAHLASIVIRFWEI